METRKKNGIEAHLGIKLCSKRLNCEQFQDDISLMHKYLLALPKHLRFPFYNFLEAGFPDKDL